jgi:predicted dehydrogenase
MHKMALIGLGGWGQRLLGVFDGKADVIMGCNRSDLAARKWVEDHYPNIACTFEYSDVLDSPEVEAVIIASSIETHASLAIQAMNAGKHVFVEKPMAANSVDAAEMIAVARKTDRILFPGHTMLYNPVLKRLLEEIQDDPAVRVSTFYAKFGTFISDMAWNLGIHDISLAQTVFESNAVESSSLKYFGVEDGRIDMATINLEFSENRSCQIVLNRLSTIKGKELTVRTESGRVLIWRDSLLFEKVGDTVVQIFETEEPALDIEVRAFVEHLDSDVRSYSEAEHALAAVKVVETLHREFAK